MSSEKIGSSTKGGTPSRWGIKAGSLEEGAFEWDLRVRPWGKGFPSSRNCMSHHEEVGSGSEGTAAYLLWLGYGEYGGAARHIQAGSWKASNSRVSGSGFV